MKIVKQKKRKIEWPLLNTTEHITLWVPNIFFEKSTSGLGIYEFSVSVLLSNFLFINTFTSLQKKSTETIPIANYLTLDSFCAQSDPGINQSLCFWTSLRWFPNFLGSLSTQSQRAQFNPKIEVLYERNSTVIKSSPRAGTNLSGPFGWVGENVFTSGTPESV